jgi:hypothetical protein
VRDEPPAGETGHDVFTAEHYVAAS